MTNSARAIVAAAGLAAATAHAAAATDYCRVVRHLADGRTVETVGRASDFGLSAMASPGTASASAKASGGSSSRSSVSLSSRSSSAAGGSRAAASSSRTDDDGRVITLTRDSRGCTILVDEHDTGD